MSDRLESEMSVLGTEDLSARKLREGISTYRAQVVDVGVTAKWIYRRRDEEGRDEEGRALLRQAVKQGLSLTCQVLSLDQPCLHALQMHPPFFHEALTHITHQNISSASNLQTNFTDTKLQVVSAFTSLQTILYRDLRMSPYACSLSSTRSISHALQEAMWTSELIKFEGICSSESIITRTQMQEVYQRIKLLRNSKTKYKFNPMKELDSHFVYLAARYGLVNLLHTYLEGYEGVDVNQEVEWCPGGTVLHVATMYGQVGVVEYLVRHGADLGIKDSSGRTPAYLAALTGHHACLRYLLAYMDCTPEVAHMGGTPFTTVLTPSQVSARYDHMYKHHSFPLLSHEDALCVLNEDGEENEASELLRRKASHLGIKTPEDLLRCAIEGVSSTPLLQEIMTSVKEETENILKQISDERFQGKLIPTGSVLEGTASVNVHHVTFLYEVHQTNAQLDCPMITVQESEEDDKIDILVSNKKGDDLFIGNNFMESFSEAVWPLVKGHVITSNNSISFAPPFFMKTSSGVCLFYVWNTADTMKFISVAITPALPTHNTFTNIFSTLSPVLEDMNTPRVHLTNVGEEWVCSAPEYETDVLLSLESDQRDVWVTCRFLNQLLQTPWWVSLMGGDSGSARVTRRFTIHPLPETVLRTLFLQEARESKEWGGNQVLLRRVVSVFCRAAQRDMRNKWVPKEHVSSFVLPKQRYAASVTPSVCGVITYLEELHLAYRKKAPKVKFS
ncbi:hypothetical protein Pmani_013570 [Petrolisthes manimaculis]|uniref:Uncharacterized protein n=2 Tax=Petrolisthes manimaculis TaxID=1843537 RepID=A0AAE1PVR4_9EUCA|nr:hypothetical protein Pmani_013570 [Petrolisthes manimaculis]